MRKLTTFIWALLLFTCPLFGSANNNYIKPILLKSQHDGSLEKLKTINYPEASPIILPFSLQYLAEQSPSDQFKKTKAFLGASIYFFYHKSLFATVLDKWGKKPVLFNPLFILFRNLRL